MGITRSTLQDFHNKYRSYQTDYYVKRDAQQQGDKQVLFHLHQLILSNDGFAKLQKGIQSYEENKQSYIKKIEDMYYEEKQENQFKILLVSQVDGADLFTLLNHRQKNGFNYKEEDACYMIECLCRGLTESKQVGLQISFIDSFSVYLTKQYTFKLLMVPQGTGQKDVNQEQYQKVQNGYNSINSQRKAANNLLRILNSQSNTDSCSVNLFYIGLLCLRILNKHIQISKLCCVEDQQIDYHLISQKIQLINDKKLKWLLWLLLNQYPSERKEVFKQLSPLFVKDNYPKDILLRGTSLNIDMQYIQKNLKSPEKSQQRLKSIKKQTVFSQNYQNQLKSKTISKEIIDNTKSLLINIPSSLKYSTHNATYSSIFQQSPRAQLPSIKLKSWLSQQTQISSLKNNSELCYSIKDIQPTIKKQTSSKYQSNQNQIKNIDKLNMEWPAVSKQQQINLSHYLSSQQESIILINNDVSDQQSEDAVKVDINDLFGDLRAEHHSINQNIYNIDYQRNQIKSPRTKSLFKKFSNSIIREESIEQSISGISGQQFEVDYVLEQYESGEKYEGYKKNGHRNGYGKFYYSGGGIYDGDWKDNQMDGYGKLFYEESVIAYEGYWKKDCFHGKGKLYNQSMNQNHGDFDYQDLSNIDNNWKVYEGQFNKDEKQGYGRLTFSNGQQFRGIFQKDFINGEGHFIRKNGTIIHGIWKESLLIRQY